MSRFVILRHELPPTASRQSHWDLMLQCGAKLLTWELDSLPSEVQIGATQLEDHRVEYLDYEGPISNNRGTVSRWDGGEVTFSVCAPDQISAALRGGRISGTLRLHKVGDYRWSLTLESSIDG